MGYNILIIFISLIFLRMLSVFISKKNEKVLKLNGAVEYGKLNTIGLVIAHTCMYVFCFIEAFIRKTQFDMFTLIGLMMYAFSMLVLFTVIYQLKSFWTVKLIIAKNHKLNESFIFKYFKHPNYFLNIIPELLSINLICKSWITLSIMLPIYLILLTVRIKQENLVMKETFSNY